MTFSLVTMLQKVVRIAIQGFISWIGAEQLAKWGVTLNVELLTLGILGLLEALRNYLKVKFGWKFL